MIANAHKPLETKSLPALMATLNSFFPLMKFLLYSSLLSALFLYFPVKIQALQSRKANTENHFHTLQISSLLPASVCTPSTVPSKRQSTLEVYHKHGPCFQPNQQNPTTPPPLDKILAYDQSRVESIQARLKPDSTNPSKFNDETPNKSKIFNNKKANLPIQSGESFQTGDYIVPIGLGTPKKTLNLILDTGSDLTWTQCQPCVGSCYRQKDPIFDPSASSSYSNISCSSSECAELVNATGIKPGCDAGTCLYAVQYGDQSYSIGFFSKETLALSPTDVFPNIRFGCGENNGGLYGLSDGILGFGRDPVSIVSQTSAKYGEYFSYCLPSTSSSTGHLTLGKPAGAPPSNIRFTPFAESKSFYSVDITGITVGGAPVPMSRSAFAASAGTIVDSGTVITRLPPGAYAPMRDAFRELMKEYPRAPPYGAGGFLDTCYDLSGYPIVVIPVVSFTFGGDVEIDLPGPGAIVSVNETQACLAFAGNKEPSDVGIFGNTQQKTFEVVYDVAGGKLGFGSGGCE